MAVLPISRVDAGKYTLNFQARKKTEDNIGEGSSNKSPSAGKMVTVPVAVLMALATTSLNAKAPASNEFNQNIDQTELLAYASPSEIGASSSASAKSKDYYKYLNNVKNAGRLIKAVEVPGKREDYTMLFLREKAKDKNYTDCCNKIVMLAHDYTSLDEDGNFQRVPEVTKLIYHNIGATEYCGAVVEKTSKVDDELMTMIYEIRLPDDAANEIIHLIANNTDYVNLTKIKFEETNEPQLMMPKVF